MYGSMISTTPLSHLYAYVSSLNEQLNADGHGPMTRLQSGMLSFVLLVMLVTKSLCWEWPRSAALIEKVES